MVSKNKKVIICNMKDCKINKIDIVYMYPDGLIICQCIVCTGAQLNLWIY